jgi:hypothetical protein
MGELLLLATAFIAAVVIALTLQLKTNSVVQSNPKNNYASISSTPSKPRPTRQRRRLPRIHLGPDPWLGQVSAILYENSLIWVSSSQKKR